MAASSLESLILKIEHLLFEGYTAGSGKAPHFAVAADDAVAVVAVELIQAQLIVL